FTDWQPDADFFMKRDFAREDSVHYWLQIDGLPQNEDVRFQYLVDGNLRIADPFSEMVLDPVHDPFLPQGVFPDLPAYPTGFTTEIVSVMRPGRIPYEWQVTDFERPAPEELVIYELLLRDFVEESTYTVLKDTLDYLERLGVNAIELMPVSQFDGNNSWGYNPVFHGALEKSYGTRRAFKEFVDEAHSRGMAVILDVVYNHAHENSPLIRLYGLGRQNNRFIGPGHAFNVFQHLNHDDPYIHYWLDRMNRYWLETFKVDGYRFDLTKGFATNVQDGGLLQGPNPERIANLKRMNNAIREFDDTAYVILEHFADNFEERQLEAEGMLLWGNHNFNYSEGMMGFNSGGNSNMSGIYFGNRNFNNPHLIGYMESHDEQWMMLKMRKFGNQANPEHNPRDLNVALDRMKLAGAFFFTIPGPKMLWQFGELGYGWGPNECLKPGDGTNGDCLASDPGRTAPKPVRWDYFNDPNRQDLYNTWADLLFMRSQSPAFTSGDTQFESFLNGNTKWIKLQHPDMDAVIIGNFDLFQQDRSITFTQSGTWYEFLSNDEFVTDGSTETFTLAPGSFKIFTTRPLSVFTSTESDERIPENPQAFELSQNYPNPFNPTTQIQYTVPQAGQVKLEVFDMLGRRVTTLVNTDNHPSGQHTVTFDASGLSSGVYLTRLSSASQVLVRKMTLIK
ncbi:MAG: alpha-amylase family glycosyl hydrolase, partial [Balneolaceae bacterium]